MYRAERLVKRIHFGNSEDAFFIRVDLRKHEPATLILHFHQPVDLRVEISAPSGKSISIPFGLPLADLGVTGEALVAFQVKVMQDGIERECYPENAPIQFNLLGHDFVLRNWIV